MAVDKKGKQLPKGITLRNDGRYMGRFTYQGEPYVIYGDNPKKLSQELSDLKYEVKHGIRGKMDKVTIGEWFKIWIRDYKEGKVKLSTLNHLKQYYYTYIEKPFSKKYMTDVKPIQIQRFYNDMAKKGYSTNTIKNVNSVMSNMFRKALLNDIILKNPCESIEIPDTGTKEKRVLTAEEQANFLSYVSGNKKWSKYYSFFVTAFNTGMRVGELLGMDWPHTSFKNRMFYVRNTLMYMQDQDTKKCGFYVQEPKTEAGERNVPMNSNVYFVLKIHEKEQRTHIDSLGDKWKPIDRNGMRNLVFCTEFGKPLSETSINRTITSIVKDMNKAGIEIKDFTPHAMRHSFATRCFEREINPKTVQEILGHTSLNMTMDLYTHVIDDKKVEEMKKLENIAGMA